MIITVFPNTLGGVSFEKAGKLYEGEETIFFDKTVSSPSYSHSFQKNDQRGLPFGIPKLMFYFRFLFFY